MRNAVFPWKTPGAVTLTAPSSISTPRSLAPFSRRSHSFACESLGKWRKKTWAAEPWAPKAWYWFLPTRMTCQVGVRRSCLRGREREREGENEVEVEVERERESERLFFHRLDFSHVLFLPHLRHAKRRGGPRQRPDVVLLRDVVHDEVARGASFGERRRGGVQERRRRRSSGGGRGSIGDAGNIALFFVLLFLLFHLAVDGVRHDASGRSRSSSSFCEHFGKELRRAELSAPDGARRADRREVLLWSSCSSSGGSGCGGRRRRRHSGSVSASLRFSRRLGFGGHLARLVAWALEGKRERKA